MFVPQPTRCWFVSATHTHNEIDKTPEATGEVLMRMAAATNNPKTGA
jgi:glutamate-1-semialdehyde aminotransferase